MNFFDAALKKDGGYIISFAGKDFPLTDEISAALSANGVGAMDAVIGIRPEHLLLSEDGIPATVDVCEMMGSNVFLHVSIGETDAVINIPDEDDSVNFKAGDKVFVSFKEKCVHIFDPETKKNLV